MIVIVGGGRVGWWPPALNLFSNQERERESERERDRDRGTRRNHRPPSQSFTHRYPLKRDTYRERERAKQRTI